MSGTSGSQISNVGGGTLFVVATPIGNLEDLTRRAERVLAEATRILAEDTRRTRGLLSHLGISGTPLDRFDAHATARDVDRVIEFLEGGATIALVSDAGTPSVSDPGAVLVRAARAKGIRVVPIPGASAVLAAVVASGVSGSIRFVGFLPRQGPERDAALSAVTLSRDANVLFEAPNRLQATLQELAQRAPERGVTVCRELTKMHEEIVSGTLTTLAHDDREWLGEITFVVEADDSDRSEVVDDAALDRFIDEALAAQSSVKKAAEIVAARTGMARREAYALILTKKKGH